MTLPTFVMAWKCDGETVVLPMIDKDYEPTMLVQAMLAEFDKRGIDPAAAVYRGIAGDRAEALIRERRISQEAALATEWYRERLARYEKGDD